MSSHGGRETDGQGVCRLLRLGYCSTNGGANII